MAEGLTGPLGVCSRQRLAISSLAAVAVTFPNQVPKWHLLWMVPTILLWDLFAFNLATRRAQLNMEQAITEHGGPTTGPDESS